MKSFIFWHFSLPQIPVSIRNDFIPIRNEFIPIRNDIIPIRNEIIPDKYWNLGNSAKNKTFYEGKGYGSIIFNFQAAAAVERKNEKGRIATFESFIWNEFIQEQY